MTINITNQVAFLRTSRSFPLEARELSVTLDKTYLEIAEAVNTRLIGIYPQDSAAQSGAQWFITSSRKDGYRQVYTFTTPGSFNHNLNLDLIGGIVKIYGTFTDGTSWFPLPYVDTTNVNNQVSLNVGTSQITVTAGSGSPPSITSGFIILEWISA